MTQFPIQVGNTVYNSKEELQQVSLGITSRGRTVTLLTLFRKWVRNPDSLSFNVYVNQWCKDNHTELPLSVNDVTPPPLLTFQEAFNELANAPAFSEATPSTRVQEVINAVLQRAINGDIRAASLVGQWAGSAQKIDVSADASISSDITIKIS